MKRLVIIGLIAIAIVYFVFRLFPGQKDQYTLGKVQKTTVTETVSESGSLTSLGKTNIFSTTTGVVEKIFVANGQEVSEKQKLFTVKSTASPQEKAEAFAVYQAAKSSVQQAENNRRATIATVNRVHDDLKDHDNDETYLQKETRTAAEVANDNTWDALLIANANLLSAQANYYSTQNSTVVAPISGQISNLSIATGSGVSANNPLAPSSPTLIIGRVGTTEIMVSVGETDINKISIGQNAEVKFDAIENKIYKGLVERYDENGLVTQGVSKFNVYITVTNPDENLKSGMNADVDILTKNLTNVLAVPNAAIKPYQKGRAVRVQRNNKIEYLPVKTGIKGKEYTQILEGITEDQEIIISLASEKPKKASLLQF
jgi:HlyD family secretion protein